MIERRRVVAGLGKAVLTTVAGLLIAYLAVRGLRGAFVFAGIVALAGGLLFFRGLAGFTSLRRKG